MNLKIDVIMIIVAFLIGYVLSYIIKYKLIEGQNSMGRKTTNRHNQIQRGFTLHNELRNRDPGTHIDFSKSHLRRNANMYSR